MAEQSKMFVYNGLCDMEQAEAEAARRYPGQMTAVRTIIELHTSQASGKRYGRVVWQVYVNGVPQCILHVLRNGAVTTSPMDGLTFIGFDPNTMMLYDESQQSAKQMPRRRFKRRRKG